MLTLKDWMEIVDYRITEGSEYGWNCYGHKAYMLDSWNGEQDGHSFTIIFDTETQIVYEVQAHDYVHNRAYRIINPLHKDAHGKKAKEMGYFSDMAWDDINYTDLEVDDDFIQKAIAIANGEDYDTRVSIPVDFTDEELLKYMTLAHERDMTFNQFIEEALRHAIEEHQRDPEGAKAKAEKWKAGRDQETPYF
jgi:Arc/MetJ family transcription regulator